MSKQRKEAQNAALISLLQNSPYYFLQCAFIKQENNLFRLIVLHNGAVLKNSCYRTARGARIAFSRVFKNRSWKSEVNGNWTLFYNPDQKWIQYKTVDEVGKRCGCA